MGAHLLREQVTAPQTNRWGWRDLVPSSHPCWGHHALCRRGEMPSCNCFVSKKRPPAIRADGKGRLATSLGSASRPVCLHARASIGSGRFGHVRALASFPYFVSILTLIRLSLR